jgi:photosystem I P700 chlorophyll a apoprotein A1
LGLGSISWAGHIFHVSNLFMKVIDSGLNLYMFLSPSYYLYSIEFSLFFIHFEVLILFYHHLGLGVFLILFGLLFKSYIKNLNFLFSLDFNIILSAILFLLGAISLIFSLCVNLFCVWFLLFVDYFTFISVIVHHIYIGLLFILGSLAHFTIYLIREVKLNLVLINSILSHRCSLLGHLSYVSLFLGLYSFGIYIYNDIMCLLFRFDDMFSDLTIYLKPIFKIIFTSSFFVYFILISSKLSSGYFSEGTSDFLLFHINSFTLHVIVLILVKGLLYSRSSRLVSDKLYLGWVYPCDGPGRGGSCQVSSFDHLFLSLFWCYNCIFILTFGVFWKLQSDVWGYYDSIILILRYFSLGDFGILSLFVNGWLGSFLWSQSSQVIQTYGSFFACYGLIFILSHFVWAFSLMFLFSGRGYWEEFIEFISWVHLKLGVLVSIQPRALSISQGRLVGLVHYLLGGVGCSWSFYIARVMIL